LSLVRQGSKIEIQDSTKSSSQARSKIQTTKKYQTPRSTKKKYKENLHSSISSFAKTKT
jgi:hypothetical protein